MSSSETSPEPKVDLELRDLKPDARVAVFDAQNRIAWQGRGEIAYKMTLPRGFYTVRTTLGSQFHDEFVRLSGAASLSDLVPKRQTPAPLTGTDLAHEYYSYPSQDWSVKETRPPLRSDATADSWLFVFIRAIDKDAEPKPTLTEGLSLLDGQGRVLTGFGGHETTHDAGFGWAAFSSRAPSGFYRLRYGSDSIRDVALQLFPGWQTQVFILYCGTPVLQGMRVFLARIGAGFRMDDEVSRSIDLGLEYLENGIDRLPRGALLALLDMKFENPMIGLIGAHLLLLRLRRRGEEGEDTERDKRLLRVALENLADLVPGAPDLQALQILASRFVDSTALQQPFQVPPMLRAGFEGIVEAAARYSELIPEDGLVGAIAEHLYADSAWTTWRPVPSAAYALRERALDAVAEREAFAETALGEGLREEVLEEEAPVLGWPEEDASVAEAATGDRAAMPEDRSTLSAPIESTEPDWIQVAVLDELERLSGLAKRQRQTARRQFDASQLAQRLGVPKRLVLRAVQRLDATPKRVLGELLAVEWPSVLHAWSTTGRVQSAEGSIKRANLR